MCAPFGRFANRPYSVFFIIFAQASRKVTVRLKTGVSGVESGSAQKYPILSNW